METTAMTDELKRLLYAYFPENVASEISRGGKVGLPEGLYEGSVLFLDIRGFTTLSESLDPIKVAEVLNMLFNDFVDIIFSHSGSINKFMGDALLVTFGVPVANQKAAFDAACCALALLDDVNLFNKVRPEYLTEPVEIGIGIASGKMFAGPVGSFRRLEYTVLGNVVNTASRLQNLTKKIDARIIIDSTTRSMIDKDWRGKNLKCRLRGKSQVEEFYTVESLSNRMRHKTTLF